MGNVSIYTCPDGTEFPVTWQQPEDAEQRWFWEQEHAPDPLKPLEVSIGPLTRPGAQRAFAEAQVPTPALFRNSVMANGFLFTPAGRTTADEQQSLNEAAERLAEREGGVREVWERFCLPRIQGVYQSIGEADGARPLPEPAELYGYGMRLTHVAGSHSLFAPVIQKFVAFVNEIGLDGERVFAEMTAGHANATLDSNAALWELSEAAGSTPAARDTILNTDAAEAWDAIRAAPDCRAFVRVFEAYLERHGARSSSWGLDYPTWQEDPASPLRLVRQILEQGLTPPQEALREGARRREAARREVEERLAGDGDKLARFQELAEPLVHYIPVREGRAYWQLALSGVMRTFLLRRGQALVERGTLAQAEDVLYLLPQEVEAAARGEAGHLSSRIEERRAEWTFWSRRRPPASIGGEAEDRTRPDRAAQTDSGLIRGLAASRGLVTARARVLADISEADKLLPGEVLVCAMSSPPWTPLFAIAAGVVTDSGGILSHPAIVAREYGIPCVVGTRTGSQMIRDGDVVTVDGGLGTVRIERTTS